MDTCRSGCLIWSPFLGVCEAGVPQEDRDEQVRSPGPGWSPLRLFRKPISMNGTLSPSFWELHNPTSVASKDEQFVLAEDSHHLPNRWPWPHGSIGIQRRHPPITQRSNA